MKKKNALMLIAGTLPALAAVQDRPNRGGILLC